ncbi:MAG: tRNA lysidine(34) synthetase TilS [Firmicutes bacterium]|nr:tRNA lysidine(34) synthetase TilS [Bacillota bacterium]
MMDKALKILQKYQGRKIAIAASGGVDSMTLCLLVLSCGYFDDITILHINHNLRETSKRDYELVKNFAKNHSLKFESISVDVAAFAKESKQSIETAAREVRYKFFNDWHEDKGADAVLMLGHTLDDNAETILMHIFRGCGLTGLVGIQEEYDSFMPFVRPLIYTSKKEIYEYAKLYNIEYFEDETNSDTKYTRNLVRKVIKEIKGAYPSVNENVLKLSEIAKRALETTKNQLHEEYFKLKDEAVCLNKNAFYFDSLVEQYIIEAAKRAGLIKNFESKHIDLIKKLDTGTSIDLPNGYVVYCDKKYLIFKRKEQNKMFASILIADADKLEGAALRFRREGDVFTKFGGGTKKLKDFFNEKGVSSRKRDRIPLLVKDDRILVVMGYEIADEVKVTKDTKKVIELWKE